MIAVALVTGLYWQTEAVHTDSRFIDALVLITRL
jgi:hypothetical protein